MAADTGQRCDRAELERYGDPGRRAGKRGKSNLILSPYTIPTEASMSDATATLHHNHYLLPVTIVASMRYPP